MRSLFMNEVMKLYDKIHDMIQNGVIISAYALESKGIIPAVSKMAFGNNIGVKHQRKNT
ncbi:MAG: hypothetical protein ACLUR5_10105 [Eubacterium ventriosum]